jgi:hypothetical protein
MGKHKTTQNFTFKDMRILNNFKPKILKNFKLGEFLQLRDGCIYCVIVMSSTNMDPY